MQMGPVAECPSNGALTSWRVAHSELRREQNQNTVCRLEWFVERFRPATSRFKFSARLNECAQEPFLAGSAGSFAVDVPDRLSSGTNTDPIVLASPDVASFAIS